MRMRVTDDSGGEIRKPRMWSHTTEVLNLIIIHVNTIGIAQRCLCVCAGVCVCVCVSGSLSSN